jgi:hypothetical protein
MSGLPWGSDAVSAILLAPASAASKIIIQAVVILVIDLQAVCPRLLIQTVMSRSCGGVNELSQDVSQR